MSKNEKAFIANYIYCAVGYFSVSRVDVDYLKLDNILELRKYARFLIKALEKEGFMFPHQFKI